MAPLSASTAGMLAAAGAGAIATQAIPPAHVGRDVRDHRRYTVAAGAALAVGGALSAASGSVAPVVVAAASLAAVIALREYLVSR